MSLEGLLRVIVAALDEAGIPFMLTGSVAAAVHGASRATMDVDVVIDPDGRDLEPFVRAMEAAELYVSRDAAREALALTSMFNVVDPASGWKADLIVRKPRPFSAEEFARREAADLLGIPVFVARIEDVILSKLEWAHLGASTRQLDDVRALLRVAGEEVDRAYVARWVDALGVQGEWERVLRG